jgi:hypothetical protein
MAVSSSIVRYGIYTVAAELCLRTNFPTLYILETREKRPYTTYYTHSCNHKRA